MTDLAEFPQLARGKGVKVMQIPPARLKEREEYVVALTAFGPQGQAAPGIRQTPPDLETEGLEPLS